MFVCIYFGVKVLLVGIAFVLCRVVFLKNVGVWATVSA